MHNYPVHDGYGNLIGMISLENEDIPRLMMSGFKFEIHGAYATEPEQKFKAFCIMSVPIREAPKSRIPLKFQMPGCSKHFFKGHKWWCRKCDIVTEEEMESTTHALWDLQGVIYFDKFDTIKDLQTGDQRKV